MRDPEAASARFVGGPFDGSAREGDVSYISLVFAGGEEISVVITVAPGLETNLPAFPEDWGELIGRYRPDFSTDIPWLRWEPEPGASPGPFKRGPFAV